MDHAGTGSGSVYEYDPATLFMLIPVVLTIIIAIKSGDIIIATTIGTILGIITAWLAGLFDIVQIDQPDAAVPAVLSVYGEGLDRTVGGVIYEGLSSMIQVIMLALLLFGSSFRRKRNGKTLMLIKTHSLPFPFLFLSSRASAEGPALPVSSSILSVTSSGSREV